MALGNAFPVRSSVPGIQKVQGVWTGGGAATACTKATGDHSEGIASVGYNAATGKYLITFTNVGQQIVGGGVEVYRLTGDASMKATIVRGGFSRSAKTVEFVVHEAGVLADLLTTDKIGVNIEFASVGVDS